MLLQTVATCDDQVNLLSNTSLAHPARWIGARAEVTLINVDQSAFGARSNPTGSGMCQTNQIPPSSISVDQLGTKEFHQLKLVAAQQHYTIWWRTTSH